MIAFILRALICYGCYIFGFATAAIMSAAKDGDSDE